MTNTLLFIDCATGGFEPSSSALLEVACMLVSASPGLEIIDAASWVIYHSDSGGQLSGPEFHRGLMLECQDPLGSGTEIRKVEAQLLAGPWSRASRIVNRGVEFDRRFISQHLPTFARGLPGQMLDVNQVEYAAVNLSGVEKMPRTAPRTYRAEDDLSEAYEALRHYLGALWNVNAGP
jgi:oligoribonuclease (3'-5' exoribonuclease)